MNNKYQMVQVAVAMCAIKETPPNVTPREFAYNLQKAVSLKNGRQVYQMEAKQNNEGDSEIIPSSIKEEADEEVGIEGLEVSKGVIHPDLSHVGLHGAFIGSGSENLSRADNDSLNTESNENECFLLNGQHRESTRENDFIDKNGKEHLLLNSKHLESTKDKNFTDKGQDNTKISHAAVSVRGQLDIKSTDSRRVADVKKFSSLIHSDVKRPVIDTEFDEIMFSDVHVCLSPLFKESRISKRHACDNSVLLNDYEKEKCKPGNELDMSVTSYLLEFEKSGLVNWSSKVHKCNLSANSGCVPDMSQNYFQSYDGNNRSIGSKEHPFSSLSPSRKTLKNLHKNITLDECKESLNAIKEEIEKSLTGAFYGIFPCWSNMHSSIKVLTCWINKLESHAELPDGVFQEFLSAILKLLFQFDTGSSIEETSDNTAIWWMILHEVKGILSSICPTKYLWFLSGNLLISALIYISELCGSVSDEISDHLSDIAHTVAEVLQCIVEYATSLPEDLLKSVSDERCLQGMETASETTLSLQISTATSNEVNDDAAQFETSSSYNCSSLQDTQNILKASLYPKISNQSAETLNSIHSLEHRIHCAVQSLTSQDSQNDGQNYIFPQCLVTDSTSLNDEDTSPSCFYETYSPCHLPTIIKGKNLKDSPKVKAILVLWRCKLNKVCLPNIENVLPLLSLQLKAICKLITK
ncbi:uncharacterized protein [Macrobrachium rosenbergii]|uniref:uncharacterized protein n=1 Tax=Macrobrachium rosenbergii TaxID=79674 RepID=UPI0034D3D8DD